MAVLREGSGISNKLFPILKQVRANAERVRARFVKTKLRYGLSFAALAKTEYAIGGEKGDEAAGDRAVGTATSAYAVVLRHVRQIKWTVTEKQWVENKCHELHNALDGLRRR